MDRDPATAEALRRTRVWRLAQQAEQPRTAAQDSVVRLALGAMAADPTSSLSTEDRKWVIDVMQRTDPLTQAERGKLKAPLMSWVKERMPRCLEILEQQYLHEC